MREKLDLFDKLQDQMTVWFDVLREATTAEQERFEAMQAELDTLKQDKIIDEALRGQKIDDALTEAFDEPKKWEPEGGEWRVGATRVFDIKKGNEARDYSGRNYKTLSQAVEATIFQRKAMRFFRWVIEQDPGFKAGSLAPFAWLLRNDELIRKLREAEENGEVEF